MSEKIPVKADDDEDARRTLWSAICRASENIQARFNIKKILTTGNESLCSGSAIPKVFTWQLAEAISLLCTILKSDDASADVLNLFGKTGPVKLIEDGKEHYLWAQKNVEDATSGLNGRPDLVVTNSNERPSNQNIDRVIEVKCIKQFGAHTVRSEFGKAFDLHVTNFLIWSYYTPNTNVIEGANQLGIDIETIGFDTDRRKDLISSPDALISKIANTQEHVRRTQRFGKMITSVSNDVEKKLLK